MQRGVLRVYLGAAPGVGKTYRMLDEGWRRKERGTDVVVAYVETHGRTLTEAQLRDLEVIRRMTREYRGTQLEEMDLDAVLARHPDVALVDELAHTNVVGSAHEKRWQDVDALLDAGIDVITTVNIQHLESVNDVVEKITGIHQQETIPDAIVRRAEQIEIVDVTPEALRRRMAHGNIYAADKIDASLSNYFRVGNLSALRELALLWLADRVEDSLQRYLDEHSIDQTWETRERLIVGITDTSTDADLLRRAARIASRTGAELFAIHVVKADEIRHVPTDTSVARELVEEFEGKFQEVVDDDTATALVAFARSERGTQIVLGASRPRPWWRPANGVVEKVLRHARDLDVHIIAVGGRATAARPPPTTDASASPGRGVIVALVVTAIAHAAAHGRHESDSLEPFGLDDLPRLPGRGPRPHDLGRRPSGCLRSTLRIGNGELLLRQTTAHPGGRSTRRRRRAGRVLGLRGRRRASSSIASPQSSHEADRARAEAQILAGAAASVAASHEDLQPLLESLRAVFAASSVALVVQRDGVWVSDLVSGEAVR